MLEKLTSNAVVAVAMGISWAWFHIRVRVLKTVGAAPYARRLALQQRVLFGGMFLAVTAVIWVPGSPWVYWPVATVAVTAFLVVTIRGARAPRPESTQPQRGRPARKQIALVLGVSFGPPVTSGVIVGVVTHSVGWGLGTAVLVAAVVMLVSFPIAFTVSALRKRDEARKADRVHTL